MTFFFPGDASMTVHALCCLLTGRSMYVAQSAAHALAVLLMLIVHKFQENLIISSTRLTAHFYKDRLH